MDKFINTLPGCMFQLHRMLQAASVCTRQSRMGVTWWASSATAVDGTVLANAPGDQFGSVGTGGYMYECAFVSGFSNDKRLNCLLEQQSHTIHKNP